MTEMIHFEWKYLRCWQMAIEKKCSASNQGYFAWPENRARQLRTPKRRFVDNCNRRYVHDYCMHMFISCDAMLKQKQSDNFKYKFDWMARSFNLYVWMCVCVCVSTYRKEHINFRRWGFIHSQQTKQNERVKRKRKNTWRIYPNKRVPK